MSRHFATLKVPDVAPIPPPDATKDESGMIRRSSSKLKVAPQLGDGPPTLEMFPMAVPRAAVASRADRAILTVLIGVNAGQAFALDHDETRIGRSLDADVLLDDAGISRRHARVRRIDGRYVLEDLGSTNGVFVNGRKVERSELVDGDRIQFGPALVLRFGLLTADEEALARRLYEGATRDALTHLYNREYASERLATEVAYANRHGALLALIMCDIDHFKRVNDTFGHPAGDVVLRAVAEEMQKTSRSEDVVARYGGEEFVVIVRGVDHEGVLVLADRIRRAVEGLVVPWESQMLRVTMSMGVASVHHCGANATVEEVVARADERLYGAKARGRNRVC